MTLIFANLSLSFAFPLFRFQCIQCISIHHSCVYTLIFGQWFPTTLHMWWTIYISWTYFRHGRMALMVCTRSFRAVIDTQVPEYPAPGIYFKHHVPYISNNPSCCLKHPGVPDGSDGSDGTSYTLTGNYTLPVALHTHLHYYAPGIRTIRTTRVLHSSQGLQLCCSRSHNAWRCLCLSSADSHILPLRYCYNISDAALAPFMFSFEILLHIAIQSSLWIPRLPLHLLRHYCILQVWNIQSNLHTV